LNRPRARTFPAFAILERTPTLNVYFARPYHAWQRGLNENTHGLGRQLLPKDLALRGATHPYARHVEHLLNTRPRKALGYRTPLDVLRE